MGSTILRAMALASVCVLMTMQSVKAEPLPSAECSFYLTPASGHLGSAKVHIVNDNFSVKFRGTRGNTLYTVWIDFKNRATGRVTEDYPFDKGAVDSALAPAFASTDGVKAGMGIDPNGLVTDKDGDGIFKAKLDYDVFQAGGSPVVGGQLAMQGLNHVGGYWLRVYPSDPEAKPSLQEIDEWTGLPKLRRATAQAITVVFHSDKVTHGHSPGVNGLDHFPAFKADLPISCH